MNHEWRKDGYLISTDRRKLDLGVIHGFLSRSYWAIGVSEENVRRRVENSLCFGLHREEGPRSGQVGFARVVTDFVTVCYLADVFVLDEHRDEGLGRWLVGTVLSYPGLENLTWRLSTRDAHELYRRYGFTELGSPEVQMERREPEDKSSGRTYGGR